MSNLSVFDFESQEIRFVGDKPVANDVARALGYADPVNTIRKKVSDKNKGVAKMPTPGGMQSVTVLEEAGVYQLIFGSKLPSAEKFQDWVFEEVLPSIRKTGSYSTNTVTHNFEWFERLKLYRRHTKIPAGWFSIFEEMCSSLMADFEDAGYSLPNGSIPDISIGKCFCAYLREIGKDTDSPAIVRKYLHHYPDGRIVEANIYTIEVLPMYRMWYTTNYVKNGLVKYLKSKDKVALPSLCRMLGLPEGSL